MRVVFRADSSARMGAGHVLRCLALADELKRRRYQTVFVAAQMIESVAGKVRANGHTLLHIAASELVDDDNVAWDRSLWGASVQHSDASRTGAAAQSCDWLVMDHYKLGAEWSGSARAFARRILVIDDLANRTHDCDLLLDQNLGRNPSDYRRLVPQQTRILAGPHFALLRPEFSDARPSALSRRKAPPSRATLIISLGSTDIDGVTAKVLEAVISDDVRSPIEVLLNRDATSLAQVERLALVHPNISVRVGAADLARHVTEADLAIGAAGVSSWERCCLGLPSVLLTLSRNQRMVAKKLVDAGAAVAADTPGEAAALAAQLLVSKEKRAEMAAAAAAITDGRGVERVAAFFEATPGRAAAHPTLRRATENDCERLWLWRNDVVVRAMAKNSHVITWKNHVGWFKRRMASSGGLFLIAEIAGEPAGMIRFDKRQFNAPHLVSINVAAEQRGGGAGGDILTDACAIFDRVVGAQALEAEIQHDNSPSQRIFERAGFVRRGTTGDGYLRYRREPHISA